MPNPTLSTSILPRLMTLYRKYPYPGDTLLSLLMRERCAGANHRLAAAPPPDMKTYMSQQQGVSYEDNQPLGQQLPFISQPMTPPPNQRQSTQQDSKGPRQTHNPVPAVQNRHRDSRLHRTIQQQQQQRAYDETLVNSGRIVKATVSGSVRDLLNCSVWS